MCQLHMLLLQNLSSLNVDEMRVGKRVQRRQMKSILKQGNHKQMKRTKTLRTHIKLNFIPGNLAMKAP